MTGFDYTTRIAPAALRAAGCTDVFRYLSTAGNPKNLTATEARELLAAGIRITLTYETSATFMLGGEQQGLVDARSARAQATALGAPANTRIFYAGDFDATAAQIATCLDFLHGAADAEGSKDRVGCYGGYDLCAAAAAAGFAVWQTSAWSNGRWLAAAVARQLGRQLTIDDVQVDVDEILVASFGQWMPIAPARTAPAPSQEDDMSTTSVNGRAGLSWAAGTRHVVQVTYDPAKGDPKLRVVLALVTGPLVLSLAPAKGSCNLEIPSEHIAACRGVIFELAAGSPDVVYDACAV